jgi:hypothetical protein
MIGLVLFYGNLPSSTQLDKHFVVWPCSSRQLLGVLLFHQRNLESGPTFGSSFHSPTSYFNFKPYYLQSDLFDCIMGITRFDA